MAISIKLKRRWDEYPALQDVLTATKNLSVSPFGLTEEGLQDFRGIKPIGKIEEISTPARGGTRRKTFIPPCLMPTFRARCGRISKLKKQMILPP